MFNSRNEALLLECWVMKPAESVRRWRSAATACPCRRVNDPRSVFTSLCPALVWWLLKYFYELWPEILANFIFENHSGFNESITLFKLNPFELGNRFKTKPTSSLGSANESSHCHTAHLKHESFFLFVVQKRLCSLWWGRLFSQHVCCVCALHDRKIQSGVLLFGHALCVYCPFPLQRFCQ